MDGLVVLGVEGLKKRRKPVAALYMLAITNADHRKDRHVVCTSHSVHSTKLPILDGAASCVA